MKQYQEQGDGCHTIGNMTIPNSLGNRHHAQMMREIKADEAEIIEYTAPKMPAVADIPITAADQKNILEPWIWRSIAESQGMPSDSSPADIAVALAEDAPPEVRQALINGGTRAIEQLGGALAELVRTKINKLMINMILAAEKLDQLTIAHGRTTGEMGIDMIERSFEHLDERRRDRIYRGVLSRLRN